MANVKKFSNMRDIGHLCAHYERSVKKGHYSNPDINMDKLNEDHINLAPERGKQTDYIKSKIAEIMGDRTLRKDAVRMCCWVVDAPRNLPEEKKTEFFESVYEFLIDRYGTKSGMSEDVCVSAYIHKSETTDHIHFSFLPVIEKDGKKRFCAKEVISRDDLRTFHEDLARTMEAKNICKKSDILNGATVRDTNGRVLSVKELKRNRARVRERNIDRWNNQSRKTERKINRW